MSSTRSNGASGGDSVAVAAKAGYLFDASAPVRLGPVVGLTYATTRVGAYTERGDPVLTQSVGATGLESLVGRAGLQVRAAPFSLAGLPVRAFVTVTAEHEFPGWRPHAGDLAHLDPAPADPGPRSAAGRGAPTACRGGPRRRRDPGVSLT